MTELPPGFFDASTPPEDTTAEVLEHQELQVATRGLEAALARVAEHVAVAREQEARDGLDESTRRLLEGLTSDPEASLERRSLHDRVAAGRLTWEQVWTDPRAEAGGRALVLDVVQQQASDAAAARVRFAEVEAAEADVRPE
ncbi:hypothetical protein [Nocardioides psychrotolerans]|uniref:hypothetical protein n=1 Tax=Nocardioides psychrotolerans TaxID=1005945 RepID=UPI00313842BD